MRSVLCELTIAIDAALSSRGMKEFYRGYGDAKRFACVQSAGSNWLALPADGSPCLMIEPVTADYLEGLKSGGCVVDVGRGLSQAA